MFTYKEKEYSFHTFVVGDTNGKAYEAVKNFVDFLDSNPMLFLYGNAGCGKTHLAKAAAREFERQNFSVKVINSDMFVSELIWCLQHKNTDEDGAEVFCRQYESVDVLILDDIHFMVAKETTQQCFGRILEHFIKQRKKILVTSNKKLGEYKWLCDYLKNDVICSVQYGIEAPDMELKKKILKNLEEEWEFELSDESVELIVEQTRDIRQVEGMFKKMMAYHQLMGV